MLKWYLVILNIHLYKKNKVHLKTLSLLHLIIVYVMLPYLYNSTWLRIFTGYRLLERGCH